MATESINIRKLLEKDTAVLPKDGEKVYTFLIGNLLSHPNNTVVIDFRGLRFVTSAFINAAIGRFLLENPNMKTQLSYISDPEQELDFRINRVVDVATNDKLRAAHVSAMKEVVA